jgi:hypothetical protein
MCIESALTLFHLPFHGQGHQSTQGSEVMWGSEVRHVHIKFYLFLDAFWQEWKIISKDRKLWYSSNQGDMKKIFNCTTQWIKIKQKMFRKILLHAYELWRIVLISTDMQSVFPEMIQKSLLSTLWKCTNKKSIKIIYQEYEKQFLYSSC